jgi:hypothetical protein
MATTTNFGWETPDDTDLVKDGAAAIRTALGGVDTSFVDLKGGTTGQVLAKASGTDLDFSWVAVDPLTILDAKGDLITATAADTPARLAVGTNGQTLVADSTASTGLKWATASVGAYTKVTSASFSGVTDTSTTFNSVFSTTYKNYVIVMNVKGTIGANLYFRGTNGATIRTTNYQASNYSLGASGTFYTVTSSGAAQASMATLYSIYANTVSITISNVGTGSASVPTWAGTFSSIANNNNGFTGGLMDNGAVDGFILSASSGTITGDVYVYGLGV